VAISGELLEILVCPVCKKPLELSEAKPAPPSDAKDFLLCRHCKLRYPIEDDIPVLIASAAEPLE
jgi:uncharacterized protein